MKTENIIKQNKKSWNSLADSFFGMTALPTYGCFIPNENELNLFGDIKGLKILDIGCGSGHSLKWCGDNGASELWGLDLSNKQIVNATKYLRINGYNPKLFNQSMEDNFNIPKLYFDIVCSIYAVGWTVDIRKTFSNVSSYLKRDGIFIFSWEHPFLRYIEAKDNKLVFTGDYNKEDLFCFQKDGQPISFYIRKMSTYINTLADYGFKIEKVIEQTDKETLSKDCEFSSKYYSDYKAKKLPLSFIIKARKL